MAGDPLVAAVTALCVFVGGLGENQFAQGGPSPIEQVRARCPWAKCILLNDEGYLTGYLPQICIVIKSIQETNPLIRKVVVVIHSMGWAVGKIAALAKMVDVLVALDPVGLPGVSGDVWPMGQDGLLVRAKMPTLFITPLVVGEAPMRMEIQCDHNTLPHHPQVLGEIEKRLM